MSVKKRVNKKIKKEIKKAVDEIPGLIFEHVQFENKQPELKQKITADDLYPKTFFQNPPEEAKQAKLNSPDYTTMEKKRGMLWIAVAIFTSAVFAMWILNIGSNFRDVRDGWVKPDMSIIDTAKNEWTKAMKAEEMTNDNTVEPKVAEQKPADLESLKNQIKNNLVGILSTLSTSTASSTNNPTNYGQASTTASSTN